MLSTSTAWILYPLDCACPCACCHQRAALIVIPPVLVWLKTFLIYDPYNHPFPSIWISVAEGCKTTLRLAVCDTAAYPQLFYLIALGWGGMVHPMLRVCFFLPYVLLVFGLLDQNQQSITLPGWWMPVFSLLRVQNSSFLTCIYIRYTIFYFMISFYKDCRKIFVKIDLAVYAPKSST